jgi:hypothetical protein
MICGFLIINKPRAPKRPIQSLCAVTDRDMGAKKTKAAWGICGFESNVAVESLGALTIKGTCSN